MKNIKIYLACFIFLGIPFACDDLTDINKNPNAPDNSYDYNFSEAQLGSVFRGSIPAIDGDDEQRVKSLMVDFYSQMLDGGTFDTRYYIMNDDWNARMFRRVQNNIANLNIVLRALEQQGSERVHNAKAISMIWRVWVASVGVDWFGPIPFASYEGEIVENPPYQSVQEIYNQFFTELAKVNEMLLEDNDAPIFGNAAYDVIFKNDKEKWRRLSNTLWLRLAMRLSEVDGTKAAQEASNAIQAGIMRDADDNAKLPPRADGGWGADYNYTMFQISWGGPLNMTKSMEKLLTGIGGIDFPEGLVNQRSGVEVAIHPAKVDPRGPKMFDPANGNGDWKGRPDGLNTTLNPEIPASVHQSINNAELGILFKDGAPYKSRPYDLMLYEESLFLHAEAALRGYVTIDVKPLYEAGVRASFATWGISSDADAYLASTDKNLAGTSANYDDNTGTFTTSGTGDGNTILEKIITQKYFGLFPDMSQEAWNDKRRLNLPRTEVPLDRYTSIWPTRSTNVKDPTNYIKRVQYPNNEIQVNEDEYNKGVTLLGGDDKVNTRIWWDMGRNYCTSDE